MSKPFKAKDTKKESIEVTVGTGDIAHKPLPDDVVDTILPDNVVSAALSEAISEVTTNSTAEVTAEASNDATDHTTPETTPEAIKDSQAAPYTAATKDGSCQSLPAVPLAPNTLVPSGLKLKRSRRRGIPLAPLLSIVPLMLALISISSDPASLPFFKAKIFDGKSEAEIADYTQAFNAHHDMDILRERAIAYADAKKWQETAKDQQELVDKNIKIDAVYRALAENRIAENGLTQESLNLLRESVALSAADSNRTLIDFAYHSRTLYRATRDLLMCGENETVLRICKMQPHLPNYEDEMKVVKALALRETGHESESKKLLKEVAGQWFQTYMLSDYYYFAALCEMDTSNYQAASVYFDRGAKLRRFMQNETLRDLTAAWLAYQRGDYSEALKKTDAVKANIGKDRLWIAERQEQAANTLLRARVFLKQNQSGKAEDELKAYHYGGSSGAIFIPKVYRSWMTGL